jgi:hypothetical protein
MARGWESKAIEAQQDDAQRLPRATAVKVGETPECTGRRAALELARARARADLAVATRPAHRQMLEDALKALDDQLAALDRVVDRA